MKEPATIDNPLPRLTDDERDTIHFVLEYYKTSCQSALRSLRAVKRAQRTKAADRHIDYYAHCVGCIRWIQGNIRQVKRSSTDADQFL